MEVFTINHTVNKRTGSLFWTHRRKEKVIIVSVDRDFKLHNQSSVCTACTALGSVLHTWITQLATFSYWRFDMIQDRLVLQALLRVVVRAAVLVAQTCSGSDSPYINRIGSVILKACAECWYPTVVAYIGYIHSAK